MPRAAAPPLPLSERDREELLQVSKLRSTPQSVALRVQIVLRAAQGVANKVLARQLSTTLPTVLLWGTLSKARAGRHSGRSTALRSPKRDFGGTRSRHCGDHPAPHAQRRDPLECPFDGPSPGDQSRQRATHLEKTSPPTPSGGKIQIQHRPAIRGQSPGYPRSLPKSPPACHCAQCG